MCLSCDTLRCFNIMPTCMRHYHELGKLLHDNSSTVAVQSDCSITDGPSQQQQQQGRTFAAFKAVYDLTPSACSGLLEYVL
jgi:hypothetical protein